MTFALIALGGGAFALGFFVTWGLLRAAAIEVPTPRPSALDEAELVAAGAWFTEG